MATENSDARSVNWLEGLARALVVLAALTVIAFGAIERVRLATSLPWQTDELPMLLRFTAAGTQVTSEEAADEFQATPYVLRSGALRALQPSRDAAALHTTTNLWTNLAIFVGGVKPWVARVMPLAFSLAAILLIGYATRAVGGGITAIAAATGLAALSPVGIIYAAQARGYAEAMFLAPLLLICVESLRDKPRRLVRAMCVMLIAIQLSLTVYTTWVYWVLPVLAASMLFVPSDPVERDNARQIRFTLGLILLALIAIMGLFTLDRWPALSFTAVHMGESLHSLATVREFAVGVARTLTPLHEFVAVPLLLGWVLVLRSEYRWWAVAMACGVLAPLVLGLYHGSAGYARNFVYLVGPAAILAGIGLERFFVALLERRNRIVVYSAVSVLLLGGMLAAWDGAVRDARLMILPNWGGVVRTLSERPAAHPRWISPCLAHHWAINWYQGSEAARRVLQAGEEELIEVVVGTTRDGEGRETVFRESPERRAVVEVTAPTFITRVPPSDMLHGVTLRRWTARPIVERAANETTQNITISPCLEGFPLALTRDVPRRESSSGLIWCWWMDDGADTWAWERFMQTGGSASALLTFKPVSVDGRLMRTMLVDGPQWDAVRGRLTAAYGEVVPAIRAYTLSDPPGEHHAVP